MKSWYFYAVGAALLYGAHQIFTKLASDRISDGLGGFVVEASAALTILLYLGYLRWFGGWTRPAAARVFTIQSSPEFAWASEPFFSFCCFRRADRFRQCP